MRKGEEDELKERRWREVRKEDGGKERERN